MTAVAERLNKSTAATYLGVSERTLDLWRAQDRGPRSWTLGGRVYWLREDCDRWLEAQILATARGGVR
jgi:predicted DNA-binding transcriptional regulator AlpA